MRHRGASLVCAGFLLACLPGIAAGTLFRSVVGDVSQNIRELLRKCNILPFLSEEYCKIPEHSCAEEDNEELHVPDIVSLEGNCGIQGYNAALLVSSCSSVKKDAYRYMTEPENPTMLPTSMSTQVELDKPMESWANLQAMAESMIREYEYFKESLTKRWWKLSSKNIEVNPEEAGKALIAQMAIISRKLETTAKGRCLAKVFLMQADQEADNLQLQEQCKALAAKELMKRKVEIGYVANVEYVLRSASELKNLGDERDSWKETMYQRIATMSDVLMQAEYCKTVRGSDRVWDEYIKATLRTLRNLVFKRPRSWYMTPDDGPFEDKVLPRMEQMVDALCKGNLIEASNRVVKAFAGNQTWDTTFPGMEKVWFDFFYQMASNPEIKKRWIDKEWMDGFSPDAWALPSEIFNRMGKKLDVVMDQLRKKAEGTRTEKKKIKMEKWEPAEKIQELVDMDYTTGANFAKELYEFSCPPNDEDAERDAQSKAVLSKLSELESWASYYPAAPVGLWSKGSQKLMNLATFREQERESEEAAKAEKLRRKTEEAAARGETPPEPEPVDPLPRATSSEIRTDVPPGVIIHTHRFITPSTYTKKYGGGSVKEPLTDMAKPTTYYSALVSKWLGDRFGKKAFNKPSKIKLWADSMKEDELQAVFFRSIVQMIYVKGETLKPLIELAKKIDYPKKSPIIYSEDVIKGYEYVYDILERPTDLTSALVDLDIEKIKKIAEESTGLDSFISEFLELVVTKEDRMEYWKQKLYENFYPEYPEGYGLQEKLTLSNDLKNKFMKNVYYATKEKSEEKR